MKNVLILYRFLPQYRIDFYNQLKDELYKKDIHLDLFYSKLKTTDALKNDEVELPWATPINSQSFFIGKNEIIWQPILKNIKKYDLIIVEQANRLLINYFLILIRSFRKLKLAYWGHGRNMQISKNSLENKFKNLFINKVDGWFAYTSGVKYYLLDHGVPEKNITIVQNAIDTNFLKKTYGAITKNQLLNKKTELNIESDNVCIYCGGLYKEKRVGYMLEICALVKKSIPDFHMLFVGGGPDAHLIEEFAKDHNYVHYIGPKFNAEKVIYFKLSKLQLMPGLVGLGILDSFALETPIVTTNYPYHSPEIEYLENDYNGVMTDDNINAFTESIVYYLKDTEAYERLIEGCRKSSSKYTVEKMVENFSNGISKCLNS